MSWTSERKTRNNFALNLNFDHSGQTKSVVLMADWHLDNPKCDQKLLRQHLDRALADNMPIIIVGDTFCAMQGKYDKRACKKDIRPEHLDGNYLDLLVDTTVEFMRPYAHLIVCIGYGNHETSIMARQETDLVARLCGGLGRDVAGGYTGYVKVDCRSQGKVRGSRIVKYAHGWGGGGPVTKGTIQSNRRQVMYPDADIIATGHVHEAYALEYCLERLNSRTLKTELRTVDHIQLPTYKEEYGEGKGGWHVERGAPPKPLGCYSVDFTLSNTEGMFSIVTEARRWR